MLFLNDDLKKEEVKKYPILQFICPKLGLEKKNKVE